MADQLVQLKLSPPVRIVLILVVLLSLLATWHVVRWYLGNTLAESLNPEVQRLDTAQMAVSLAPSDPLTHWRLGKIMQRVLPPDQISQAVVEYEKAVSLSPNDYRLWLDYGAALEQAGESERADKALRVAVKLAPSYAFPRWHLGNLLLRDGRYAEAFVELQRASDAHEQLQPQLFNLAWQVYKDDFYALQAAIGTNPASRTQFSQYLVARGRFEEGLRLWNTLSAEEKNDSRHVAHEMINSLIAARRYHAAVNVWNDVARGVGQRAEIGRLVDPGLEENVNSPSGDSFGWQFPSVPQVQVANDASQGHTGGRSLRIAFQVRTRLDSVTVSQLVPVQSNTEYELEYFIKTEKLVSVSTPVVLIVDAADETVLTTSASAPNGDNDWQRVSLSFKSGEKAEAVRLRINRTTCPDSPVCPIFGTVWYDDFNLKPRK